MKQLEKENFILQVKIKRLEKQLAKLHLELKDKNEIITEYEKWYNRYYGRMFE